MSDRDSAYIFGRVFEMIDKHARPSQRIAQSRRFWKMSLDFDFAPEDMHADKTLKRLGLARDEPDPDYPDETMTVYRYGREWR